ncbi:hypothetical protein FH972_025210 [Carpinus fangiana]|uniref:DUF1682 domain-containing protein n=1 Tax=Carpinus fangiana TaxID=176857 RepID=A0A5N6L0X8_9ROSI|nr:hypothetical protein FH972_025210 [Carpinus fangiana]
MADFIKGLFGGPQAQKPLNPAAADEPSLTTAIDFADFAHAPAPTPASIVSNVASAISSATEATPTSGAPPYQLRPYTKWYRVWERVYLTDFYSEMFILPFIIIVIAFHLWGSGKNRRKARAWAQAHIPLLDAEYASVGFDRANKPLAETPGSELDRLRKVSEAEYLGYASGRQNVAFVDIKLTLAKRFNPMARIGEEATGFLFESMPAPRERMEATAYPFDGTETALLAASPSGSKPEKFKSSYDGFVFAIVHKDSMKFLRDGRYDLSLTQTRDHAKLPAWATVMSESAEITDALLTPDLVAAVAQAGDAAFEALILSDQPIDKPQRLQDTVPKKRVSLSLRLPAGDAHADSRALFTYFLRLPDLLAAGAHFRPEALRRVRATRDDEVKKLRRADEDERAEERRVKLEKDKKEERDRKLKGMSADEQQADFRDWGRSYSWGSKTHVQKASWKCRHNQK